jgi:hypothetical protein
MSLETKSLAELEELAVNLVKQIARKPEHSRLEQVELKDVQDWLTLRRKEAAQRADEETAA